MSIIDAFSTLKSNLELKSHLDQLAQQRHAAVRSAIENSGIGVLDTKLIGSYQRRTRIHPSSDDEFDIDILVVLGEFSSWVPSTEGITTLAALGSIHSVLNSSDRYSAMSPQIDAPTVRLSSSSIKNVEIVPAYLDKIGHSGGFAHAPVGRAYWIPDPGNISQWKLSDYDYDADCVSTINQNMDQLFIPTIKMLKAIRRNHFPALSSYSLEALAATVLPKAYAQRKLFLMRTGFPYLLLDFFIQARPYLSGSISMPGSLTPGTTLDQPTSHQLNQLFETVSNFVNTLIQLDEQPQAYQGWKKLFGTPFPAP